MIDIQEIYYFGEQHPIVQAAIAMAEAHMHCGTMMGAVDAIEKEFPEIERDILVVLWIGINAKWNAER